MSLAIPGYQPKKHENPYKYTESQLAEKDLALKKLKEYYPTVPTYYAELAYDMCANTNSEKLAEIMEKVDSESSKYKIPDILVSNVMEIVNAEDSLQNRLKDLNVI
jgi:hypothetical protein